MLEQVLDFGMRFGVVDAFNREAGHGARAKVCERLALAKSWDGKRRWPSCAAIWRGCSSFVADQRD
jgi:hypothetical protein